MTNNILHRNFLCVIIIFLLCISFSFSSLNNYNKPHKQSNYQQHTHHHDIDSLAVKPHLTASICNSLTLRDDCIERHQLCTWITQTYDDLRGFCASKV